MGAIELPTPSPQQAIWAFEMLGFREIRRNEECLVLEGLNRKIAMVPLTSGLLSPRKVAFLLEMAKVEPHAFLRVLT
jgi:hypothetical protein